MFRRLRNLLLIAFAAGLGALVGRWVAEARARVDSGDDPLAVDLHDLQIRPQDFVPGVVAAFRVGEPPWSWLHIPSWFAAFATNFAAAAVGGDLDRLRQMAEDRALSALGLEPDVEIEIDDVTAARTSTEAPMPEPPVASPAAAPSPEPPPAPASPASGSAAPSSGSAAPSSHQTVWTSENAAPNGTNGKAPETETPGFTPLRD